MSDTEKLIEAAERWAKNVSESPGNGTAGEDLYGARLLISLAAALRETTAREEAAELDAAQLRAAFKVAGHTSLAEEMRKGLTTAFELAKVARERDALAAANVAANKRIVALEHERDAARAALARLTTPRPIAEAPRDGTWILGCWPENNEWPPIVMRWTGKEWQREDPAERDEGYMPTHFLPLLVLP